MGGNVLKDIVGAERTFASALKKISGGNLASDFMGAAKTVTSALKRQLKGK